MSSGERDPYDFVLDCNIDSIGDSDEALLADAAIAALTQERLVYPVFAEF